MSVHDPFDGIYDDVSHASGSGTKASAATAEASNPPIEAPAVASPTAATTTAAAPPAPDGSGVHTRSHLMRMRKSELQALARAEGLDAKGDRDDLIAAIYDAQRR